MSERDPLTYDPDGPSLVNAIERALSEATGLEWHGVHKGQAKIAGAAQFHALRRDQDGRYVLAGVMLLADVRPEGVGGAITADMLRRVPITAMENARTLNETYGGIKAALAGLDRLEKADRSDPVAFSRLVAEHFRAWAEHVPHPVAAMAAEANVKPPTVHTWVREARLRGFLPPARRGKG